MAIDDYNDFLAAAIDRYDFTFDQAQQFYRDLRDAIGETPTVDSIDFYAAASNDLAENIRGGDPFPIDDAGFDPDEYDFAEYDFDDGDTDRYGPGEV